MKARFAVIAAVLATSLLMPRARAATSASEVEPLEFRQLIYLRSIDAQGDAYAESLSYLFVYLHRHGCTFSLDPLTALRENPRARLQLSRGLLNDAKLRASVKEWMKVTYSAITADFDSLGGSEAVVLSRDALSSALLSSPRFWEKISSISATENFDFRPVIHREIRGVQYAGNAVAWVAMGGIASAAFRALNLSRVALVAMAAPAVAITSVAIWDFARTEEDRPKDAEALKSTARTATRQAENEIRILREHQRRLVVLSKERDVRAALKQMSIEQLKREQPEIGLELAKLKPQLVNYRAKLESDEVPIKKSADDPQVRADVIRAIDFLLDF